MHDLSPGAARAFADCSASPSDAPAPRPRVLVLDDDAAQRELIRLYLQDDYDVTGYAAADAALAALAQQRYDLVVSDIHLPGLDGLGFRARLAERNDTDLLPFIFITGTADERLKHDADQLGIDDYLLKPLRKRELLGTLRRVLARGRARRLRWIDAAREQLERTLRPQLPERLGSCRVVSGQRGSALLDGLYAGRGHDPAEGVSQVILVRLAGDDDEYGSAAQLRASYLAGLLRQLPHGQTPAATLATLLARTSVDPVLAGVRAEALVVHIGPCAQVTLAGSGRVGAWVLAGGGFAQGLELAGPLERRLAPGERLLLMSRAPAPLAGGGSVPGFLAQITARQPLPMAAERLLDLLGADPGLLLLLEPLVPSGRN